MLRGVRKTAGLPIARLDTRSSIRSLHAGAESRSRKNTLTWRRFAGLDATSSLVLARGRTSVTAVDVPIVALFVEVHDEISTPLPSRTSFLAGRTGCVRCVQDAITTSSGSLISSNAVVAIGLTAYVIIVDARRYIAVGQAAETARVLQNAISAATVAGHGVSIVALLLSPRIDDPISTAGANGIALACKTTDNAEIRKRGAGYATRSQGAASVAGIDSRHASVKSRTNFGFDHLVFLIALAVRGAIAQVATRNRLDCASG